MSDKVVQVRDAIKEFAQAMERRARYGHKRVVAEEVMAAKFMSIKDMLEGAERNGKQVWEFCRLAEDEGRALSAAEKDQLLDAAADVANYLRMAVEKIRAAEA